MLRFCALKQFNLPPVYPFIAMSFMVMLSSSIFLGEPLQASRAIGMALVITGLPVTPRG